MDKFRLYHLLEDGFKEKQRRQPVDTVPRWRGGNSGCLTDDGVCLGEDPRKAVLRFLGIEKPITLADDLIFHAGFTNEDHWTELLKLAPNHPYVIRCEEECPVQWKLNDTDIVTGRPDLMLFKDDKPVHGVELKLISSNGKMARHSHFGDANPVPKHWVQAAHYSWQYDVPWTLAYTSRAHYTAFYFGAKKFQLDHPAQRWDDKGQKVVSVGPFISMYDLTWEDDTALMDESPTLVTASGIRAFYEYCARCVQTKTVPTIRSGGTDVWGAQEKKNDVLLYDDFKEARTDSWSKWVHDCKLIAGVS